MRIGEWVLLAAVTLAIGFGLWRTVMDGRFRGTHRVRGAEEARGTMDAPGVSVLDGTPWADQLGEHATLLQFSSSFCAPCRTTRILLADVAERTPGVAHLEVDAEHHLDVVRRLGIMRTPTTLVLDPRGYEVLRAQGVPRADAVRAAIGLIQGSDEA